MLVLYDIYNIRLISSVYLLLLYPVIYSTVVARQLKTNGKHLMC